PARRPTAGQHLSCCRTNTDNRDDRIPTTESDCRRWFEVKRESIFSQGFHLSGGDSNFKLTTSTMTGGLMTARCCFHAARRKMDPLIFLTRIKEFPIFRSLFECPPAAPGSVIDFDHKSTGFAPPHLS